jgi:CRISPR system Cascade subunit CasB
LGPDASGRMDARLQLLARQDLNGLHRQLPRLVLHLRADLVRIDWPVLVRDLARWGRDPRQVAKEWMQSYYRTSERLTAEKKHHDAAAAPGRGNEET